MAAVLLSSGGAGCLAKPSDRHVRSLESAVTWMAVDGQRRVAASAV
jgi:hypothetical protein